LPDLCPTGALTSRHFRFKRRVWTLKKAASVCRGCATGCLIEIHYADNRIYRIVPEPYSAGNRWLCDRGRLLFRESASEDRLFKAVIRNGTIDTEPAIRETAAHIEPGDATGIFGSPWLSAEDNASMATFARDTVKTGSYCFDFMTEQKITDGILSNSDSAPNTRGAAAVREEFGGLTLNEFRGRISDGKIACLITEASSFHLIADAVRTAKPYLTVFSLFRTSVPAGAQTVIPYADSFESEGTYVNYTGRAVKSAAVLVPPPDVKTVAYSMSRLASYLGKSLESDSLSETLGRWEDDE